jgi:hypothetical protein
MKPAQREVASNEVSELAGQLKELSGFGSGEEIYPERLPERKRLHDCRQEFYWNDEDLTQAK